MKTPDPLLQSPLNYTGGKYRLLPQLLPHFPKRVGLFVDLFCGGGNVGINAAARQVLFNDADPRLMGLLETFRTMDRAALFTFLDQTIHRYGLTRTSELGYAHYGCESGKGVAEVNRPGFLRLRADFNHLDPAHPDYYPTLYALVLYAFNNQLRFNGEGQFNLPVGKRDFNQNMRRKLGAFLDRLQSGNYLLRCGDFRGLDPARFGRGAFLYADPPYLITTATYNERGGWDEAMERALLDYLDAAHAAGVRFALSNVLESKGRVNEVLLEWTARNRRRYTVHHLNYHYGNANYHTLDRTARADEILVVNR